jgi:hypothetical protein
MQRTGTSVIHACIGGHPEVASFPHEVGFVPFFAEGASHFTYGTILQQDERAHILHGVFDALATVDGGGDVTTIGIKSLMLKEGHARELARLLSRFFPDIKVIRLRRNDLTARFGSLAKARLTNIWHRSGDSVQKALGAKARDVAAVQSVERAGADSANPTITLDRYAFLDDILTTHVIEQGLDVLTESHDVLTVDYESDVRDQDMRELSTVKPIWDFLDLESVRPDWIDMRKLSLPPSQYIANYAALRSLEHQVWNDLEEGASPADIRNEYGPPVLLRYYKSGRWHAARPGATLRKLRRFLSL